MLRPNKSAEIVAILLIVATLAMGASTSAFARTTQKPEQVLPSLVEQLQANPKNDALRKRIIQVALGMKAAPSIPRTARSAFIKASTYLNESRDSATASLAVDASNRAVLEAPW